MLSAQERWRKVREILYEALELEASRRATYLDQACAGDAELRAEVDSLIAASEQADFLDAPVKPELHSAALTLSGAVAAPKFASGKVLSQYEIVEKIGEGGMGEVYKARDTILGRMVALKILLHQSGEASQRFRREARMASSLNHPNIVTVYKFGNEGEFDYIAMEFVEGQTLQQLMKQADLSLGVLLEYSRQAASAIEAAHAAGVIHRDLKPTNIMVTPEGSVKVLDFGLARYEVPPDADGAQLPTLTLAGMALGTPAYMSPEQANGEKVTASTDVFSLGVILYELACGTRPFQGKSAFATIHQVTHLDPPSPRSVNPDLPHVLTSLIERCLRKSSLERPASMKEVRESLESALRELKAPPASRSNRSSLRYTLAGVVCVMLSLVAWWEFRAPVSLAYAIEAQKVSDGKPSGEPYIASASDTFQAGWKFRLRLEPAAQGYIYVINKGPGTFGSERYWILDHEPVEKERTVVTQWFAFDDNPGTERLWLLWSATRLSQIEDSLQDSPDGSVRAPEEAAQLDRLLGGRNGATELALKHR